MYFPKRLCVSGPQVLSRIYSNDSSLKTLYFTINKSKARAEYEIGSYCARINNERTTIKRWSH